MTLLAYFSKAQNCCLFNLQYKPNLSGPFKIEENYSKSNSSVSKTGLGIKVIFERVWSYRVLCSKILVGVGLVTHAGECEWPTMSHKWTWLNLNQSISFGIFHGSLYCETQYLNCSKTGDSIYLLFSYQRKLPWWWQKWVNWEESEGSMVNSCALQGNKIFSHSLLLMEMPWTNKTFV